MAGFDILGDIFGAVGSYLGGVQSAKSAENIAAQNIAQQQTFARHGISWKVQDAMEAGINPLAALGATTSSFSNVVGDTGERGKGLADAASKIGHAMGSMKTREQEAAEAKMDALKIRHAELENLYLQTRIARENAPGRPTGVQPHQIVPGQAQSGAQVPFGLSAESLVKGDPMKTLPAAPGAPAVAPASEPEIQYYDVPGGGKAPYMSKPSATSAQIDFPGMLAWNVRNRLIPTLSTTWGRNAGLAPPWPPAPGHEWYYAPLQQAWYQRKKFQWSDYTTRRR